MTSSVQVQTNWALAANATSREWSRVVNDRIENKLLMWFLSAAIGQRPRNYWSCSCCCSSCSPFGSLDSIILPTEPQWTDNLFAKRLSNLVADVAPVLVDLFVFYWKDGTSFDQICNLFQSQLTMAEKMIKSVKTVVKLHRRRILMIFMIVKYFQVAENFCARKFLRVRFDDHKSWAKKQMMSWYVFVWLYDVTVVKLTTQTVTRIKNKSLFVFTSCSFVFRPPQRNQLNFFYLRNNR